MEHFGFVLFLNKSFNEIFLIAILVGIHGAGVIIYIYLFNWNLFKIKLSIHLETLSGCGIHTFTEVANI